MNRHRCWHFWRIRENWYSKNRPMIFGCKQCRRKWAYERIQNRGTGSAL